MEEIRIDMRDKKCDVGDYEVVVGSPARLVKTLEAGRFE